MDVIEPSSVVLSLSLVRNEAVIVNIVADPVGRGGPEEERERENIAGMFCSWKHEMSTTTFVVCVLFACAAIRTRSGFFFSREACVSRRREEE